MKTTLVTLCLVLCGCGPAVQLRAGAAEPVMSSAAPLERCTVELPAAPVRVAASPSGLVVGLEDGTLLRGEGAGCALALTRTEVVGALLDVDELGNAYVMAAPDFQRARFPDEFGDLVVRLAPGGDAKAVVSAGRGIWGFGVSPSGRTIWVSACGPTGVLSADDLSPVLAVEPPWELDGAALTGDDAYWTTRPESCATQDGVTSCAHTLVKTTKSGDVVISSTSGASAPRLTHCGSGPCLLLDGSIRQLDASGAQVREWTSAELGLERGEPVLGVGLTAHGLYTLHGAELHFTPR